MDDIVLQARTRWQLRRAIAALYAILRPLDLRLHRSKRFIGKTTHGFDFLGYQLHPDRKLRPSRESLRRLRERARRLYEREVDSNGFVSTSGAGSGGSTGAWMGWSVVALLHDCSGRIGPTLSSLNCESVLILMLRDRAFG